VVMQELAPIAQRLKALRENAGMSQQSLAVSAGLSVSLVSQIERGSRADPRMSTITALAGALGITLDELVGRNGPAPRHGGTASPRSRSSGREPLGAPEPLAPRPAERIKK
jgi:transcriptional regulator with XRE-family HTH domain